jgi:hypothetical protein
MGTDGLRIHRDYRRAVQADVEEKLGRALTEAERFKVWNCPSGMMSETLAMAAYYAKSPQDVERALAEFPTFPALPDEYTQADRDLQLRDVRAGNEAADRPGGDRHDAHQE